MQHSTGTPTKYEQERIDALRKLGCSACAALRLPNVNHLELHHILDGGVRMGHWFTFFLCRGHHQGDWSPQQLELIAPRYRVAISDGRKAFVRVYPPEKSLWMLAQRRLRLSTKWPDSKILPRRIGGNHVSPTAGELSVLAGAVPVAAVPAGGAADADRVRRKEAQ